MATKPTPRIPVWASTGSKTDPGGTKEAAGWSASEKPPANWFNWLLNSIGQWLGYFDDLVPCHSVAFIENSDTIVWSKGVTGVTAIGGASDHIIIELSETIVGNHTPIVTFQAGSAPGQIFVPACAHNGTQYYRVEWYDMSGVKQDPSTQDIDFTFAILGDYP
jgi:hypothetical protein